MPSRKCLTMVFFCRRLICLIKRTEFAYQGQLAGIETKRKYTDDTYKESKATETPLLLTKNHYTNFVHLCFPSKVKSKADNKDDLAARTITVNNFFAHWIKEINVVRYGDDVPVLPTTNMVDVYQYSHELLKHIPKEALTTIENDLLYCKDKGILAGGRDRRQNNTTAADAPKRTDANLTKRTEIFQDQLKNEYVYRIPLTFLCNLGLINQCIELNTKLTLMLETEINKLFETNGQNTNLPVNDDAEIIIMSAPYIQYEQIELYSTSRAYLQNTFISQTYLRAGIPKTPYQRIFEINVRSQSHVVDFRGANKQFSFVSILLAYDKSDQHNCL